MSVQEAALIQDRTQGQLLVWSLAEEGFVVLQAHPCPLLEGNRCTVYDIRPYNCRRWGCFRPDPQTEPLEPDQGFLGCANARERFQQSRPARREMLKLERKAQRWALAHGWTGQERAEVSYETPTMRVVEKPMPDRFQAGIESSLRSGESRESQEL